jgi:hypothetical protein
LARRSIQIDNVPKEEIENGFIQNIPRRNYCFIQFVNWVLGGTHIGPLPAINPVVQEHHLYTVPEEPVDFHAFARFYDDPTNMIETPGRLDGLDSVVFYDPDTEIFYDLDDNLREAILNSPPELHKTFLVGRIIPRVTNDNQLPPIQLPFDAQGNQEEE